jgi:hypothetical protein
MPPPLGSALTSTDFECCLPSGTRPCKHYVHHDICLNNNNNKLPSHTFSHVRRLFPLYQSSCQHPSERVYTLAYYCMTHLLILLEGAAAWRQQRQPPPPPARFLPHCRHRCCHGCHAAAPASKLAAAATLPPAATNACANISLLY